MVLGDWTQSHKLIRPALNQMSHISSLPCPFGDRLSQYSSGYPGTHYIAQAGLAHDPPAKLPSCWNYRPIPSCLAPIQSLKGELSQTNNFWALRHHSDCTVCHMSQLGVPGWEQGWRSSKTVAAVHCASSANGPFSLFTGGCVKRTMPPNQTPVWMEGAQPICSLIEFTSRTGSLRWMMGWKDTARWQQHLFTPQPACSSSSAFLVSFPRDIYRTGAVKSHQRNERVNEWRDRWMKAWILYSLEHPQPPEASIA